MSTSPASQANDKHMAMRAQRSKEGSSAAQQAASSAAPVAANTPSNNPSAPLSTSPADKPAAAGGDKQKEKQEPKQKHQQEKKEKQEPKQKQQQQQGEKQQGQKEKQQQQQGEKQQQKKQQQQNQGDKQQNIRKSGKDGAAEGGDAPVDPARARKQSVASHTSKPNQFDDPKERQRAQKKQVCLSCFYNYMIAVKLNVPSLTPFSDFATRGCHQASTALLSFAAIRAPQGQYY
jgi:hypothetical protein